MAGSAARSSGANPARSTRANAAQRRHRGTQGNGPGPGSSDPPVRLSDLYRGHPRLGLMRDLAFGEFTHEELASSIHCDVADVDLFAQDYEEEIAEVRAALAGKLALETSGLWISKKQNRLAELQSDADDLREVIETLRVAGKLGSKIHNDAIRARIAILKAAAEELNPRVMATAKSSGDDDKNVMRYVIEDPDVEAMR